MLTSDELWEYAQKYTERYEKKWGTRKYPTFAAAKRKFKCTFDDIESACSNGTEKGYLGVVVALGGAYGYVEIEKQSQYQIEAY